MAYNTKLYKSTGSGWDEVRVGSDWSLIANKPTTFTPTSHSHSEYVKISGNQTITGIKQIDNSDLRMNGGSVSYLRPVTTGGWARGFWWQKNATDDVPYQCIGGIGVLGNNLSVSKFYIGYGESPWTNSILEAFPDYVNINGTLRTIATSDSDPDNTVATKGYVDSKSSLHRVVTITSSITIDDNYKHNDLIICNNSSDIQINTYSYTNHPIGTRIDFYRRGSGRVKFFPQYGSIVAKSSPYYIKDRYMAASLIKISQTEWLLIGALSTS